MNAYLAIFFVVIAGSGAAMLILHVALDNSFKQFQQQNEVTALELQQSILNSRAGERGN